MFTCFNFAIVVELFLFNNHIYGACSANGYTKRQDVKELIGKLNLDMPGIKKNLSGALTNTDKLFIWDKEKIK